MLYSSLSTFTQTSWVKVNRREFGNVSRENRSFRLSAGAERSLLPAEAPRKPLGNREVNRDIAGWTRLEGHDDEKENGWIQHVRVYDSCTVQPYS